MARIRRPGSRVVPRGERPVVGQAKKKARPERVDKPAIHEVAAGVEERGEVALKHTGGARHKQVNAPGVGTSALDARLAGDEEDAFASRLGARGTKTIPSSALAAFFSDVLAPLAERTEGASWNRETWDVFQRFTALESVPSVVEQLRLGLKGDPAQVGLACARAERSLKNKRGAGPVRAELRELRQAIEDPAISQETLGLLLSARGFARDVEAQLPGLPPERRAAYFEIVHDVGYARGQLARAEAKDTPLCAFTGDVIARLPDALRGRFTAEARADAAGAEGSMPKLTLLDLVDGGGDALAFLAAAGKDVDAPSTELGGASLRSLVEGKDRAALAKHQVLNAFARPWADLTAEADRFGPAQRRFLDDKQTQGVVPALMMVVTPGALERALSEGTSAAGDEVGQAMHTLWTALQTGRGFDDPLIGQGFSGASAADRDKNQALFGAVVNHAKTRALSGLADRSYDQRLTGFLEAELGGDSANAELVTDGVRRLMRDSDPADPLVQSAIGELALGGDVHAVMRGLHQARFEPSLFRLESTGKVKIGDATFSLKSDTPAVVGATNAGFRVTTSAGEEALLWLPKGAKFRVEDGALKARVTDAGRFSDTAERLLDHDAVAARNGLPLTEREVLKGAGFPVVLERGREAVATGESALASGYKLTAGDVDRLVDTYTRGLTEVDEARGRKFGVLYELGPDNWVVDADKGLMPSYLDVAMLYRTERDRDEASFFSGGYGAAANWITGDSIPMPRDEARAVWRGDGLDAGAKDRLGLFRRALHARLEEGSPIWKGVAPEVAARARATLRADLAFLDG